MKRKIKNSLDNPHSIQYQATQKELYNAIDNMAVGGFIKIEYNKIPSTKDRNAIVESSLKVLDNMDLTDFRDMRHKKVLKHALNSYEGELKVAYYKRPDVDKIQDESGYVLFQDNNNNWKKVDIRNVISITNSDGITLTRNVQKS